MNIALLGSAPSSIMLAPFKDASYKAYIQGIPAPNYPPALWVDQTWEIWACSPGAFGRVERCTRFFELHRWEPGAAWFSPEYCQWLREFRGPVYTGGPIPEIKNHVVFPIARVEEEFGSYFLTSSLSLMLAMAILEITDARAQGRGDPDGNDTIGMWGVDMAACPHPDTRVLTADLRWVRAGDLKVGDKLLAFDEHPQQNGDSVPSRRWRTSEVLRADAIYKPCYQIYFEDGTTQICSDEHQWLTYAEHESRWKMTKDLVTSNHRKDRPTRIVKLCDTWEEDKSWEAGYIAAAFDGEGWICQKLREDHYGLLRIGFAQRENAMSDEVKRVMAHMGFDLARDATLGGMNGDCHKYSVRGGRAKNMEFLGRIRPRRLLDKFNPEHLGMAQKQDTIAVERIEFIGEQPVVGLTTSTKTFVAEGLASHNTEEWAEQRPGCQHFLQEALRRGIRIFVPPESDLLRPMPVYGLSEWDERYIKSTSRMRELNARKQLADQNLAQAQAEAQFMRGAVDDMNYNIKTWCSPYGLPTGVFVKQDPGTGAGGPYKDRTADSGPMIVPAGEEPRTPSTPAVAALIDTAETNAKIDKVTASIRKYLRWQNAKPAKPKRKAKPKKRR